MITTQPPSTKPAADPCVDILDDNCNSNADGKSLADAPEKIGSVVSSVKDWMEENSRIAHENSSIPGWVRFAIKASTAYFTTTIVSTACAVSAAGAVATGGGSLAVCIGAIGLGYLANATVGYVVDNNECLSWEGWARNLSPDKALGSWLQWPPW